MLIRFGLCVSVTIKINFDGFLFSVLVSSALLADEIIHCHDSLDSEKGYRSIVEKEFPKLKLGFYSWDGD